VKRTSAEKFSSLYTRNEKEISRVSDRARCARNFAPIARSRTFALEAIMRDREFSRIDANLSRDDDRDRNFLRDRENIF